MAKVEDSDQDTQAEVVGQSRAAPKLSAPAQVPLELFAKGFDRSAPHGRADFLRGAAMKMILVRLEIVHFTGDDFLMFD